MRHSSDKVSLWTHSKFYFNGDKYFAELLRDLQNAKERIFIETYILEKDTLSELLFKALELKKKEGVEVLLHVDGIGCRSTIPWLKAKCQALDIQFKVFNPLPQFTNRFQQRFVFISNFFVYFKKLNQRNHRKLVIIDHQIAYLGSLNWSALHTNFDPKALAWRDTGCQLQGPGIKVIEDSCLLLWQKPKTLNKFLASFKLKSSKHALDLDQLRMNIGQWQRYLANKHFIDKINGAQSRIWITNAYFMPRRKILHALSKAAQRGVDVKVLSPGPTDVPVVKWAFAKVALKLLLSGVRLYEYKKSVLHAKTALIDNWICLGSANLNHRSSRHDLEIEVGFENKNETLSFVEQWEQDLLESRETQAQRFTNMGVLSRLRSEIAYRLRYLL
jgi:cardiolipin synthase